MDRVRVTGGLRPPRRLELRHGIAWAQIVLSGALMWAAFPFWNLWPLTVVSLALLVGAVSTVNKGRAAAYSAVWAMVFFLPHISWMQIATDNTWIAWFALAGAQAFFVALWGVAFAATKSWNWARSLWGQPLVAALLWVTFEQLRSRVPFGGFPWGNVSYPQVNGPLVGLAPIGGEVLTSFAVMTIAALLWQVVSRSSFHPTTLRTRAVMGALAAGLFFIPGLYALPTSAQAGEVEVAVIQGNVEIPMATTFAIPRKVTGNHVRQTTAMLQEGHDVDLILWGENATDIDPRADLETAQMVAEVAEEADVPMLIGVMEYTADERFNWMAVWDPREGLLEEMYGKQHPVPWGEYVPMRGISEFLATASAQISVDMASVENPGFMEIELNDGRILPLGVGICFEVAYEPLIAEGVRMGGEAIIIPTNNAHFQNSAESDQQLQMAQFRAAEFSRAAVQVSTNGVSGIVRPDGSVSQVTGTQEAAHLVGELPLRTSLTPFAHVSAYLPGITMAIGLVFSILAVAVPIVRRTQPRR